MSITYEEALGTLEAMFGAPWTRETLDAVLRHFKGHMENTVESILAHGDLDPAGLIKKLRSGAHSDIVSMDEELAKQLAKEERKKQPKYAGGATPQPSGPEKKGRGTPVDLPADFLRIPGYVGSASGSAIDEDEALARMLQDELFSQELANNPEFAHLARGRPRTVGGLPSNQRGSNNRVGDLPSRRPADDGSNFMEKVTEMGENTKRRLQLFAAQFNAKVTGIGGNNSAAVGSGGQGGTSGVAERRGLLDDDGDGDDGMELAFAVGGGGKKSR